MYKYVANGHWALNSMVSHELIHILKKIGVNLWTAACL